MSVLYIVRSNAMGCVAINPRRMGSRGWCDIVAIASL